MDGPSGTSERLGREQSKLRTRSRLLEAGRNVFLRTGYRGATLDGIAAEAGFTKGALYAHFSNKQALFLAIIAESIATNLGTLDGFLELGKTDPLAMQRKLGEWVDDIDERESLPALGVELEIESRHDENFRDVHQRMIEGHEAALASFLDRYFALVEEEPALPIAELARVLVTIFKGFALCRQNRPDDPVNSRPVIRLLMGLPAYA